MNRELRRIEKCTQAYMVWNFIRVVVATVCGCAIAGTCGDSYSLDWWVYAMAIYGFASFFVVAYVIKFIEEIIAYIPDRMALARYNGNKRLVWRYSRLLAKLKVVYSTATQFVDP